MKKAISYWTIGGFEGNKPIAQAMEEAKGMGYQGIELSFGGGELTEQTTQEQCRDIVKLSKKIGIEIPTIASVNFWGQSLAASKAEVREKAVNFTKKYLQVARWLGVNTVLVIPGAIDVGWDLSVEVIPYDQVWKNAVSSLKKVLPTAAKLKVSMGLENVWNKFLLSPLEMKLFIDTFKNKFIGSYFDVANPVINGYPEHWISILGKRIKAVHFKNFSRSDAAGVLHGFGDDILKGDVNWAAVMKALRGIGFKGFVTAEMIPFCRLPNLVLPDMDLARETSGKLDAILKMCNSLAV